MEFEGTIKCVLCHGRLPYDKNSFSEMEMHLKTQHRVIFFMNVLIQHSKDLKNKEENINVNMHIKQEIGERYAKGIKKETDIVIDDDEIVIEDDESTPSETVIVDESSDDDISPKKIENNTNCDILPSELRENIALTNERANTEVRKISNIPDTSPIEFAKKIPEEQTVNSYNIKPQNIVINNNKHGELSDKSSSSNKETKHIGESLVKPPEMNRDLGKYSFSNNESTTNATHLSVSNNALFNKYEDEVSRAGLHEGVSSHLNRHGQEALNDKQDAIASDPYIFNESINEASITAKQSDVYSNEQKIEIYKADDGFFSVQIEVKKTEKIKNDDLVSNNRAVSSKILEALEVAKDVVSNGTDDFIIPRPVVSIDMNENKVMVDEFLLRESSANSLQLQEKQVDNNVSDLNPKAIVINQSPRNISGPKKSNIDASKAQNNLLSKDIDINEHSKNRRDLVSRESAEDSFEAKNALDSNDIDESDMSNDDNMKRRILFDSAQHKPKKKLKLAPETKIENNKKITLQDKRKYLCEQCNKLYVSKLSLKTHVCKGFQLRVCKVKNCEASFDNKYDLDLHSVAHMENQPPQQTKKISCNIEGCSETFENSSQLREHEFSAHLPPGLLDDIEMDPVKVLDEPVQPLPQQVEKKQGKVFHCSDCGKAFSSEHGIKVHKSKMHS